MHGELYPLAYSYLLARAGFMYVFPSLCPAPSTSAGEISHGDSSCTSEIRKCCEIHIFSWRNCCSPFPSPPVAIARSRTGKRNIVKTSTLCAYVYRLNVIPIKDSVHFLRTLVNCLNIQVEIDRSKNNLGDSE